MDRIFEWIRSFIYFGLFLTILMQLLPDRKYKKYVRFFAGMIFLVLVLGPVFSLFTDENILESAVEKMEYQQEQESVSVDFSYMEEKQQEYYSRQMDRAAEEMIRQEAEKEGFSVLDSQIRGEEETGNVQAVTVTVQKTEKESETEEKQEQDQITAVEAVRIRLSGEDEEQEKDGGLLMSASGKRLKGEIADLFGIPEKQVEILEE